MLNIDTTVIVKDSKGREYTLCLIEAIAADFLVVVEPSVAEKLLSILERSKGGVPERAIKLLTRSISILEPRAYRFLSETEEKAAALRLSQHHLLRLVGLRLEGLPEEPPVGDLSKAFAAELQRRSKG